MVPLEIPLKMLEYLKKEKSYVPWEEASRQINYLDVFLQETDVYDKFKVTFSKEQVFWETCLKHNLMHNPLGPINKSKISK